MSATLNVWAVAGCSNRCLRTHAAGSGTSVSMGQARNSRKSFQILVLADDLVPNLDISVAALSDGAGNTIAASNLVVHWGKQIEVVQSTYRNTGDSEFGEDTTGHYPDALIPTVNPVDGVAIPAGATYQALPYNLPADQTHTFLVDIFVSKTTPAGTYVGTVTVTADGQSDVEVSVSLKVWNVTLPDTSSLKTDFGSPAGSLINHTGWVLTVPEWNDVAEVCNTVLANNSVSAHAKEIDLGDLYFHGHYLRPVGAGLVWAVPPAEILIFQAHIDTYTPSVYVIGSELSLVHDVGGGLGRVAGYNADTLAAYIAAIEAALVEVNRPDTTYVLFFDEQWVGLGPGDEDGDFIRLWCPVIYASTINCVVLNPIIPYHDEGSLVGAPNTWGYMIKDHDRGYGRDQIAAQAARKALGEEIWWYPVFSGSPTDGTRPYWHIDRDIFNHRVLAWMAYHEGVAGLHLYGNGIWMWHITEAGGDPWTEPCTYMATGGHGTVAVTNGSPTITFSLPLDAGRVGSYIRITDSTANTVAIYRVSVVGLIGTLAVNYVGNDGAAETFRYNALNGDGAIVYPCTEAEVGYNGIVPSMRLLAVRDGVQDHSILTMAKELGFGDEVDAIVNALITAIGEGSWEWNTDPAAYDEAIAAVAALIESVEPPPSLAGVLREELGLRYSPLERTRITGNVTDYVGRTIDVLAYDGALARGEVLLDQTLAQPIEGGKVCTGIQKLAQRVLLELLTEKGTMPYMPTRGTDFMYEARIGQFRTQNDVYGAMSRALVHVKRNLQAEENDTDPDDERYKSAEILQVVYASGEAKIWMRITSQDDNAIGILPISTTI